ncbi:hypothetical protein GMRT_24471 [Giardia muris]|uniref:Uncharacterized protein n=1 Tax=Giardia muris TaxID=5742 RepID=A0A4Z1SKN5_GIAMU|nr:hypothetical protein GMRT_24471 [Giardia muris]|eukprot:TNJ26214.1 hypothetical protein GMRT_24471 [Giardia muris]
MLHQGGRRTCEQLGRSTLVPYLHWEREGLLASSPPGKSPQGVQEASPGGRSRLPLDGRHWEGASRQDPRSLARWGVSQPERWREMPPVDRGLEAPSTGRPMYLEPFGPPPQRRERGRLAPGCLRASSVLRYGRERRVPAVVHSSPSRRLPVDDPSCSLFRVLDIDSDVGGRGRRSFVETFVSRGSVPLSPACLPGHLEDRSASEG